MKKGFENGRKGQKSTKIYGTVPQDCQTKIVMQNSFMDPLRKNKFGRFSRMDSGVFGSKLVKNGLKEVEVILKSEAVLAVSPQISEEAKQVVSKLQFRIQAVLR